MSRKVPDRTEEIIASFPPPKLPTFERPSSEEIERRQQMFKRAQEIREAIRAESGPLDISTDELKHLAREEAED